MTTMRACLWTVIALSVVAGCGVQGVAPVPTTTGPPPDVLPSIQLKGETDGTFEVIGFSANELARLNAADVFAVRVDGKDELPPLLGTYSVTRETLSFKPRFPLQRGVRYRAAVRATGDKLPVEKTFLLPKPQMPPTVVTQVYPTRSALPENLLRFYIHFSAPMARGDVYKYIRLLGDNDKPVESPFLELEQELWDATSRRFTLFIHPGRIKRGLVPREELGPVLEQGKSYTLEISREWSDANGEPLKETYRKRFTVSASNETQPDPKTWKLQTPAAGKREPLVVTFPKPLDEGMLERVLVVKNEAGQELEGTIAVTDEETRWRFTPTEPWRAGAYRIIVDTALEDPAGNSIKRPFEVDVFRPVESRVKKETVEVPFAVK
jgi:hypothetical protein